MMDRIKEMYDELFRLGKNPDTAVMNYRTYLKLLADIGSSRPFISPPELFLPSGKLLTIEINDTMKDEEIIICDRTGMGNRK